MPDIAKMILESIDNSVQGKNAMKDALLTAANKKSEIDLGDIQISEEIDIKMKKMKGEEDEENLVWIDYPSWNALSEKFREMLIAVAEPLFWSGVYFKMSVFEEHKYRLLEQLDQSGFLALLTESQNNHKLQWVGSGSYNYDLLDDRKLILARKEFKERCIKTYANDKAQGPISKLVKEDKCQIEQKF